MITFGLWLLSNSKLLLQWAVTHWRIVLVILMALAIWHYKSAYEDKTREFELFQTNVVQMAKDYEAEQAVKLDKAKENQAKSEAIKQQQITDLNLDRETLQNAIRSYYAPHNNKPTMVSGTGIVLPQSASADKTSEASADSEGYASSERVNRSASIGCEAKVEVLENALALEAIDFNSCRARVDQDCTQIGCEVSSNP